MIKKYSELRDIFNNKITVQQIYEPLKSYYFEDDSEIVKSEMEKSGFDVSGVKESKESAVEHFICLKKLKPGKIKNFMQNIEDEMIISDYTAICDLIKILSKKDFIFVQKDKLTVGIVTKADFNKIIFRIYLFAIISLFEMQITEYINNYEDESWKSFLSCERKCKLEKEYLNLKRRNENLSKAECLQLADKRKILSNKPEFREIFNLSKRKFNNFFKNLEKIRNNIAHSIFSVFYGLNIDDVSETIDLIEKYLGK